MTFPPTKYFCSIGKHNRICHVHAILRICKDVCVCAYDVMIAIVKQCSNRHLDMLDLVMRTNARQDDDG